MTYARSFICPPACFLKGRLVFQADCLLGRLSVRPTAYPTVNRHTLYNSGHPLSSIIRSPVLHAHSPPSSICLDRHRSSVCRAHGWTANHQLYQQFGISEFFVFSPAFHRALAFCCYSTAYFFLTQHATYHRFGSSVTLVMWLEQK